MIEILAVDGPEALEGSRGPGGEGVQGVIIMDKQNRSFLEDPASYEKGELLKDDDVEVGIGKVLKSLVGASQMGAWIRSEHEADVDIRVWGRVSSGPASEKDDRKDVRIALCSDEEPRERRIGCGVHERMIHGKKSDGQFGSGRMLRAERV